MHTPTKEQLTTLYICALYDIFWELLTIRVKHCIAKKPSGKTKQQQGKEKNASFPTYQVFHRIQNVITNSRISCILDRPFRLLCRFSRNPRLPASPRLHAYVLQSHPQKVLDFQIVAHLPSTLNIQINTHRWTHKIKHILARTNRYTHTVTKIRTYKQECHSLNTNEMTLTWWRLHQYPCHAMPHTLWSIPVSYICYLINKSLSLWVL